MEREENRLLFKDSCNFIRHDLSDFALQGLDLLNRVPSPGMDAAPLGSFTEGHHQLTFKFCAIVLITLSAAVASWTMFGLHPISKQVWKWNDRCGRLNLVLSSCSCAVDTPFSEPGGLCLKHVSCPFYLPSTSPFFSS
jgi:hypothetical protein